MTWRVVLFLVLVIGLVAGAFATIEWYGRSTYFVGFDGDRVAIYKGRPGGLLWLDPELVQTTRLSRDRVPPARVNDLEKGQEQGSLAEARRYVTNVSEQADELDPPTTTTASTTTTTRPARPPATGAPTTTAPRT